MTREADSPHRGQADTEQGDRTRPRTPNRESVRSQKENAQAESLITVQLTEGEIWSLLMQYKDRDLGTADRKLSEAYKAATGKDPD